MVLPGATLAPVQIGLACGAADLGEVPMKPEPGRFNAAMLELQALVTTPNPDAVLIEACERCMVPREVVTRMYQAGAKGYRASVVPAVEEWRGMQLLMISTPARTRMGRMAKANVALAMLSAKGETTDMARSAIHDFLGSVDEGPPA
jgi:hypothetical protein